MIRHQMHPRKEAPGTVLILCIALLVILGMLASGFVIITLYERSSSRSLSRADNLEQVRQMSLEYVRTLLLEDIVDANGRFLRSEVYDAPGSADPWLASRWQVAGNWAYLSKVTNDPQSYTNVSPGALVDDDGTDTDGNGPGGDARWITRDPDYPFTNMTTADGTKYRVAIRIVDTNALANINVGQVNTNVVDEQKLWDGQYPAYLNLQGLMSGDTASFLDVGDGGAPAVPGRYNEGFTANPFEDLYLDLYRYLATGLPPDPEPVVTPAARPLPFDVAEEIALRLKEGPDEDLHGRLGELWPTTFGSNSHLLTAYSWTMQIRRPTSGANPTETDVALESLGYPSPCKIPLTDLVASDGTTENEPACRAVYLALLATGMNANDAAQFMVNLIDYIDDDTGIRIIDPGGAINNVIDVGALDPSLRPTNTYYGTDSQPIISEVYSYRYYDGTPLGTLPTETYTYILNETLSRYAVELFNPSIDDIDLSGWTLNVGATTYNLSGTILAGGFWIISSHSDNHLANGIPDPKLVRAPPGPPTPFAIGSDTQTIELVRQGPGGAGDLVVVDSSEEDFGAIPTDGGTDPNPVVARDFQRPGNNVAGNLTPVIDEFESAAIDNVTLGDYAVADNAGEGGQIVLNNTGELHSLGELFYVPKVANDGSEAKLIEKMEGQPNGDSDYRLGFADPFGLSIVFTLRTGLYDGADNDGDRHVDAGLNLDDGVTPATNESILLEARVPGLININTAPDEVLLALHAYPEARNVILSRRAADDPFDSPGEFAQDLASSGEPSYDEGDPALPPPPNNVGSPDGIDVDNEEKLFHFKNVVNLISVRSDVFAVYITVQAYREEGIVITPIGQPLRTMTIVDRSYCLRPYRTSPDPGAGTVDLATVPLPRILAQTTIP